ncbi:MAG: SpoIIE family protein phosphatase [Methanoregula sp.]|nr:SpoIIE family protein phosphatase [Methanoregula sp.]
MTSSLSRFKGLSVRQKILIIFLSLSLISLLITGLVAFVTISDIGNYAEQSNSALGKAAVTDSTIALQSVAESNLMKIAADEAEITNIVFVDTAIGIEILAAQAVSLQNNPPFLPIIPSFPRDTPPPDPFSGTVAIFAPGSTSTPQSDEYRTLAGMDDLLMAVNNADAELTGVYVATDSGIMRMYPWDDQNPPDYDPRVRDWFINAKTSSGYVWSGPYVDASGNGLIVTCSRAVPTKYGTWVIATDVTTDTINQNILGLTLDGSGYAVLVDSRGNVISRPGLSAGNTTWNEAFTTENLFDNPNPGLVETGRKMVAGKSGIDHVRVDNEEIYIAYAPVKSLNWSFALSMPASQIVAPVKTTESKIIESTRISGEHIDAQTTRILQIFVGLFIILLIVVILLSFLLARIITQPVELLRQGTVALGKGDLDFHLTIETGDEFEVLAHSFNTMAADLKKNIEDLRRTTAEKERYAKEMEIAKEIQDNFLPEFTPAIPGIELAATTLPAMEIGGDLYDFIAVQKERWGLAIADVSGKGVSAALFMALCSTIIRVSGGAEADPSVVLEHANQLIYADGRSSMFITIFYCVLDPVNRKFTYVNAGHNPPMLVRGDPPKVRTLEEGRCIALGVVPEVKITCAELVLEPDDLIVMYTDGVTEAFNPQDEEFGEERLMDYLQKHRNDPVQEIIDGLIDEVRRFCGNRPQSDDITLVIVRVI